MIQFNRSNPAIASFTRGMQQGNQERRAEDQDFRQRLTFERGLAGDRAVRQAIGDFYANETGQRGSTEVPVQSGPDGMQVVAAPPTTFDPASGAGEFGAEPPIAMGDQGSAPAAAAPAPAPQGGAQPRPMSGVMRRLAAAPGTGAQMMQLFSRDQSDQRALATEEKRLKAEGSKAMLQHLKDGDVRMARATAQQYGIRIPDAVWANRSIVMNMRTAANLAKTLGIKDEHAVAFTHGYVEAMGKGAREDQAMLAGLQRVPKGSFKAKGHVVGEDGTVHFYDEGGNFRGQPPGASVKARPTGRGGGTGQGGGSTATIQNRDDMARRIKLAYPGLPEDLVQRFVVNPRAHITPQDVIKVRVAMQKQVDGLGRPLYKTTQELDNAVKQVLEGAKSMAGFVAPATEPAPQPGAPSPAPAAPATGGGAPRRRFNTRTGQFEETPAAK